MTTDKGQFDEVLRRMIERNPQKTAEIATQNENDRRTRNVRRKRNPEIAQTPTEERQKK